MKFFKKKDRILDLSERYRKQQARAEEMKQDMQESSSSSESNAGGLGFFGAIANTVSDKSSEDSGYVDVSDVDGRRRKLARRLMEMTNKIEELSNQIYHLQQRIEVLEKKSGVGSY